MDEPDNSAHLSIPEHLVLSRLEQSDQMREFFIQMWIQNPELARQAGGKVQSLLRPLITKTTHFPPSLPLEGGERNEGAIRMGME